MLDILFWPKKLHIKKKRVGRSYTHLQTNSLGVSDRNYLMFFFRIDGKVHWALVKESCDPPPTDVIKKQQLVDGSFSVKGSRQQHFSKTQVFRCRPLKEIFSFRQVSGAFLSTHYVYNIFANVKLKNLTNYSPSLVMRWKWLPRVQCRARCCFYVYYLNLNIVIKKTFA